MTFRAAFTTQWTYPLQSWAHYDGWKIPQSWAAARPAAAGAALTGDSSRLRQINKITTDRMEFGYRSDSTQPQFLVDTESPETVTEYVSFYNFNLGIPSVATIDGIEVLIRRGNDWADLETCRLTLTAATLSPGNRLPAAAPAQYDFTILGGPADTFGAALTPATVNSPDFGVAFRWTNFGSTIDIIDVAIRVYYTIAPADVDGAVDLTQQVAQVLSRSIEPVDLTHLSAQVMSRSTAPVDLTYLYVQVLRSVGGTLVSGAGARRLVMAQGE